MGIKAIVVLGGLQFVFYPRGFVNLAFRERPLTCLAMADPNCAAMLNRKRLGRIPSPTMDEHSGGKN